jgi:hypothetical protein
MTLWKQIGAPFVAAIFLVGMSLAAPPTAQARGDADHDGHGHVGGHFEGHHGFRPYFGAYWGGPYWGPYWGAGWGGWWGPGWWGPYEPEGGVSMHAALMAGYGAIKTNVNPKQAEVWADGKPIAEARDLDGTPSYLWLKAGEHKIQIYKSGYVTYDQMIDVHAGIRTELRVNLVPGSSVPPTPAAPAPNSASTAPPAKSASNW